MTTMFAQLMDAQVIKKNASTLLLTVTITILALLILAIQYLDANMHLCLLHNLMTTMHAPEMFAPFKMELNIFQSLVIALTNALSDLATLLKDANTVKKFVMTTTFAQVILALMDNVSSLLLSANNKVARLFLVMQTLEDVFMQMLTAMITMHVPLIFATATLDFVFTLLLLVLMQTNAQNTLAIL
jgi:hypothetical protein